MKRLQLLGATFTTSFADLSLLRAFAPYLLAGRLTQNLPSCSLFRRSGSILSRILPILSTIIVPSFTHAQEVIGVSTSLTGNTATYGLDVKNYLEFANSVLANNRYRFIFEDDHCSGKDGVSVAQKLIKHDKVKYVLGHACSNALLASAPVYEQAKVVVIAPCASAPAISNAGEYIFRTWQSDAATATQLADYISAHHKSVGVITEQTEFAEGFSSSFKERAAHNGTLIYEEEFQTEAPDQRSLLLKLKAKKIDGLFLNAQSEFTLLNLVKQVREMGLSVPLYNEYNAATESFLTKAGSDGEGMLVIDAPAIEDAVTDEGKKLYEQFVKKYGPPSSTPLIFATTFEAFRALTQAIESGQDPQPYLLNTTFNGILGAWSFDRNGDPTAIRLVMKRVKGGKAVLLE